MPIIHVRTSAQGIDPQGNQIVAPPPLALQLNGPCLQVAIGLAQAFAAQLVQQGQQVPAPIAGRALIDTGAISTCIDDAIAQQLRLPAIDVVQMSTASQAQSQHNVYPAHLEILGPNIGIDASRAIGAPLQAQGIIALIGRDVLRDCLLVYNGGSGDFTLAVG